MKISDIFYIKYGVNLELNNCEQVYDKSEGINFVSRTSQNNGVVAKVKLIDTIKPQKAGTLTVAGSGSVLSTFVQTKPYYSGRDLYVLTPKYDMTLKEKLYYCMCINKNSYRYGYGRQANKTLKDIELPDTFYKFKNFDINFNVLKTNNIKQNIKFNLLNFHKYKLSDLFDVVGTNTTSILELESYGKGKYPYITTQSSNNGVGDYFNFYTELGNVLVIDSAVAGYCSYQKDNFSASDHVEKLIPKFKLNKYIAQFIVTIINKENYKYTYGRKFNQEKIKNTEILLPVDSNNKLDLNYMEQFIKSLPYSDKI